MTIIDSLYVQGGLDLYAATSGNAPYTYAWNTGENTMNIYVVQSGTYCVTVTDASGCTAEDCVDVDFSNFCDVYIWLTGAGSLNANTQGIFPVSYSWSTGDTTSIIYPSSTGDYCVTISDGAGCEASDCYYFELPNNDCTVSISQGDSVGITILQAFRMAMHPTLIRGRMDLLLSTLK